MNTVINQLKESTKPIELESLSFPGKLKILVMGPHPDDFDAVAVTMRFFHQRGDQIRLLLGRTGGGVEDTYCTPSSLENKAVIREHEQRASCRFFGLDNDCLLFLDPEPGEEELLDTQHNISMIKVIFDSFCPDIVVLPHGNDTNVGHRSMYSIYRKIISSYPHTVMALLTKDPKTIDAQINIYTAFGEKDALWKAEMLRFHDTQQQRNINTRGSGLDERILRVNMESARKIGLDAVYAEAFESEFHKENDKT